MFFFKQKTAYEMRISDWSSDVCSSDLSLGAPKRRRTERRSSSCLLHRQRIAGAASAGGILHKNTSLDQIVDVAQGGVGRRLGNRRPFGIGQLALEPVQKPVQDLALAFVQRLHRARFPEQRLAHDPAKLGRGACTERVIQYE